jgi:anti-sigma-K factor RskA
VAALGLARAAFHPSEPRRCAAAAATGRQLAAREATLNAIFEPDVQMFQLTAGGDPDPGMQLFWDRRRHRAILHGFKLRQVPAGRAYQLWFIKDGAPVPSVTFKPEPDGHVKLEQVAVPEDGTVSAAAVTLEPESGRRSPPRPSCSWGSSRNRDPPFPSAAAPAAPRSSPLPHSPSPRQPT